MRTIAPINTGFLLNSALLILFLARAHVNGEVNSKELLGDVGFDLEANDVESTSTIATQTTTDHNGGGCRDKNNQCRASWFNNCNDQYWRRQCPKKCGVCSGSHSHNPHSHTPHSHTPHSHSHSGGQQADNQAGGCYFCGKECPKDCWNAMKSRVDEVVGKGGHIYNLYGFPDTIKECRGTRSHLSSMKGSGNPGQVYYNALVKMVTKYYNERKKNSNWSPGAKGWLYYGVDQQDYCKIEKCGPIDYASYGRSSALGCTNTCRKFHYQTSCNRAAPKCKWVAGHRPRVNPPWWVNEHCAEAGEVELLQTTDNTADKTETADTMRTVKRSNELDRLLDDVQMGAKKVVGGSSACW